MKLQPLLLIACLLTGINFCYGQNTYYVTQNGAGAMNGVDWADAYNASTFRGVLNNANSGSVFWLAEGTYTPGNGRDSSFSIPSGVQLYGGFPSSGNPAFADRNISTNITILSGEIGSTSLADNCYHVVTFSLADSTTILDGFTITGGYANGISTSSDINGAGIYNDGSFSALVGSRPIIRNCTITNNYASTYGAGIYNNGTNNGLCEPKIINCVFSYDSAGNGGAIFNDGYGGECTALVNGCKFIGNSASTGSAVYNTGTYGGNNYSQFVNCLFNRNYASAEATYASDARQGTSGASGNCITSLFNCTFTNDSASIGGTSIISNYTYNAINNCITNLTNCIIWDNSLPLVYNYTGGGYLTNTVITYSDVQGGYSGTGNLAVNPLFIDPAGDNYIIASCSPCINAGTSTGAPNIDIDSTVRPIDGGYDMGAYESVDTGLIATTIGLNIAPSDTLCAKTLATFTANTNVPTPNYFWKVNGTSSGTNSPYFTNSTLANGDVVSCMVTSNASCLSPNNASSSIQVYIKPLPTAGFTFSKSGSDYNFTDTSVNSLNIKWLFGDGDTSIILNPSHTYSGNGNYTVALVAYNDCGTDTSTENISLANGINNIGEALFTIYPNPANDILYIEHPIQGATYTIYDMTGRIINLPITNAEINISTLPQGIYSLHGQSNNITMVTKFVKE